MKRTLLISLVTLVMMMGMPLTSHLYADDEVYSNFSVDKLPVYDNQENWYPCVNYVIQNLQVFPQNEGRVICQLVVEKDGSIEEVTAVRSCGDKAVDNEVIRLLKTTSKKWAPAQKNGEAVRCKIMIPVNVSPKK